MKTNIKKELQKMKHLLLSMIKQSDENNLKMQNVLDEWAFKRTQTKNFETIDKYYEMQLDTLHNIGDLLYTNYYNIIHEFFSNEVIDEINKQIGYDFMSEKFLNVIFK